MAETPDQTLAGAARLIRRRGDILFRAGDRCAGFIILHRGSIKVTLTAENGREIVLYRVRPGEICLQTFGCLMRDAPYLAEAVAEGDVELDILPRPLFEALVGRDAVFRKRLFDAVASRFADMERLVEDVALSGIAERLARALLRLCDARGEVHATHEVLAVELGSARAVVTRQLGAFARDGIVELGRGSTLIRDPARLETVASRAW